jgi:anion-transporting  ArsA/GET3 family ATPase
LTATATGSGARRPASLESLVAAKEIVISCGPGGVGKTTVAAALGAMAAVKQGSKVLVVTVDPARRLADALGLEGIGDKETQVPSAALADAGARPRGELWAAMLDTKQSWDNLVWRHAPDARTARRILRNRLYDSLAGRFVQSHEYIAMERLYELHAEGSYDLIVVDTPPTRDALDFVHAPERMAEFFSSRLLRVLSAPSRSAVMSLAFRPFFHVADRILGSQFLEEMAEFFSLFQTMAPGFVRRAEAVGRVLHEQRTAFLVVSTLEAAPVSEAEYLIECLRTKRLRVGALVLNKVLPEYLLDEGAAQAAACLQEQASSVAARLAADGLGEEAQVSRVLNEVAESFLRFRVVAQREAEHRSHLAAQPDVVRTVPYFDSDIHDLGGVLRLGEQLWRSGGP